MAIMLGSPSRFRWLLLAFSLFIIAVTYNLYFSRPVVPVKQEWKSTPAMSQPEQQRQEQQQKPATPPAAPAPSVEEEEEPVKAKPGKTDKTDKLDDVVADATTLITSTSTATSPATATSSLAAKVRTSKWGPPEKGEVLLVTASSGNKGFQSIPNLKEMVYENRMSYCLRHGYDHMWANISSYNFDNVPVYWNKIPILQDAWRRYPKAEWLWWLDLDIILMNQSLDLWTHLLSPEGMARNLVLDQPIHRAGGGWSEFRTPAHDYPDNINFLIASGGWGMNVGSFLMRRGEWSNWLLDMWADPLAIQQNWVFPENDGWTHLYKNHKIVRDHTGCTNQRALNGYGAYNSLGAHWHEGDILVHFAGCGNHTRCPEHWDKYWNLKDTEIIPDIVRQKLDDGTAEIENVQRDDPYPVDL